MSIFLSDSELFFLSPRMIWLVYNSLITIINHFIFWTYKKRIFAGTSNCKTNGPEQICSDGYCYHGTGGAICPSGLTQLQANACGGGGAKCTSGKCPDGSCTGGCIQVSEPYLLGSLLGFIRE